MPTPPRPLGTLSPAEIWEEHKIFTAAVNRDLLRRGTMQRMAANSEAKDWQKYVDELSTDPERKRVVRKLDAREIEARFMK